MLKKFFLLLILIVASAHLISCDPSSQSAGGENEVSSSVSDETEPLEIDNNDLKNTSVLKAPEDIRQAAVDYMYAMSQVKWKPETEMDFSSISIKYSPRETYYGLPYNVWIDGNLEGFERYIDDRGVYAGPSTWSTAPGNHCTSSIKSAWLTVSNSISFTVSINMLPDSGTGILAVGEYDWTSADKHTSNIIEKNSADIIYEAYALAKKGDAILSAWGDTGHARMLAEDATVVRYANGKINPTRSFFTTHEQTNAFDSTSSVKTTWKVNKIYTFEAVYKKNYIPITIEEFVNGKAEDATFALSGYTKENNIAETTMLKGTIKSNYRINKVDVSVTDESGKTVISGTGYPYKEMYILTSMNLDFNIKALPAGTYTYKITASVGFGTASLLEYKFTK